MKHMAIAAMSITALGGMQDVQAAGCAAYEAYGAFENATVSMLSPAVAPIDQAFIDSFRQFEGCTGITIEYQGDSAFDAQIRVRLAAGNPPDVAIFAQPGAIRRLVDEGSIVKAPQSAADNLAANWPSSWTTYVTIDGVAYGTPLGASVKSLVWYSPARFSSEGWSIPTTLDELEALSARIAATGAKPWCEAVGFGDATGWPLTDWMEDMMLRLHGAEVYDAWVAHTIPFNGSEATAALDAVGAFLKNPAYVNGGLGDVSSIATTEWTEAGLPVASGLCAMYRSGSYYSAFWAEGTTVAPDGDVFAFYMPATNSREKPVLGGGEFLVAFTDRPEVQAFQTFMSSGTWANAMVAASKSGWISANREMDASLLTNPIDQLAAQILQDEATVFRYDGSDLMPPQVGTVSFWRQMTDWILGKSTKDALDAIEASWP
jgi:alpha-glucoside transport system substrate-binding protein